MRTYRYMLAADFANLAVPEKARAALTPGIRYPILRSTPVDGAERMLVKVEITRGWAIWVEMTNEAFAALATGTIAS